LAGSAEFDVDEVSIAVDTLADDFAGDRVGIPEVVEFRIWLDCFTSQPSSPIQSVR